MSLPASVLFERTSTSVIFGAMRRLLDVVKAMRRGTVRTDRTSNGCLHGVRLLCAGLRHTHLSLSIYIYILFIYLHTYLGLREGAQMTG